MPNAYVGMLSEFGIGTETTEGTPVKAQHLIGVSSSSLAAMPAVIPVPEDTGIRNLRGAVWGTVNGVGSWTMPVRHDKITKVLQAHFGSPSTSGDGPYVHIYKTKQVLNALTHAHTLYQNRGQGQLEVYPGAYCNSLNLAVSRDNRILTAVAGWMTRGPGIYDYSSANRTALVDEAAAYDADNPWVFDKGTFTLHSSVNTKCRSFNFTRSWAMDFEEVICPTRGSRGVTYGEASLTGSIDLTYDNHWEYKRFMGASAPADPYVATQAIVIGTLKLDFSAAGSVYSGEGLTIEIDEAVYSVVDSPLSAGGALVQRCDFIGFYDSTDTAEMKLTVTNSESAITTAGTNITGFPGS